MDYTNTITGNVRRIIQDKGLKQKAVANWVGLTDGQLSDLLRGRKVMRADMIPLLASALGVGIEDLYEVKEATP